MKKLIIVLALFLLIGCGALKVGTPYGEIEQGVDSQIFAYTDADVTISADKTLTDDTTLVIVGIKDSTNADMESIFNHAMTEIRRVFEARQAVYERWLNK